MKITISKSQWEEMGRKAGWKVAEIDRGGDRYRGETETTMEDIERLKNFHQYEELPESIEERFAIRHSDISIAYVGQNNEGAGGRFSIGVEKMMPLLKKVLSPEQVERFLDTMMARPDKEIAIKFAHLMNALDSNDEGYWLER